MHPFGLGGEYEHKSTGRTLNATAESLSWDSNVGPFDCEADMQTTTAPCCNPDAVIKAKYQTMQYQHYITLSVTLRHCYSGEGQTLDFCYSFLRYIDM